MFLNHRSKHLIGKFAFFEEEKAILLGRWVIRAIPILLLLFILNENLALFGRLTVSSSFSNTRLIRFTNGILAAEKNLETGDRYRRIVSPEVTISAPVPYRKVKYADVEITYDGNNAFTEVEFPRKNIETFPARDVRVIRNGIVDQLKERKDWVMMDDPARNALLFQRIIFPKDTGGRKKSIEMIEPRYATVENFLQNPPLHSPIQEYNDGMIQYYTPAVTAHPRTTYPIPFRGGETLLLYVAGSTFQLSLEYEDHNISAGADPVGFALIRDGVEVNVLTMEDDGDETKSRESSGKRTIDVVKENIPSGYYVAAIHASSDIFFSSLSTGHPFVFLSGLSLHNSRSAIQLFTGASEVSARTMHENGLDQNIRVGDQNLPLTKVKEQVTLDTLTGIQTVVIPKADVILSTNGWISPRRDDLEAFGGKAIFPLAQTAVDAIRNGSAEYVYFNKGQSVIRQEDGKTIASFRVDFDGRDIERNFEFTLRLADFSFRTDSAKLYDVKVTYHAPLF